jgi:hypothetical protein
MTRSGSGRASAAIPPYERTLLALAERWTAIEPTTEPAPSPFAGTPDLNDERAIETSGVPFLEGEGEPAEITAALRRQRPATPVVFEQRRRADGSLPPVPEGCTPLVFPCSVKEQIDALWRALASQQDTPA